MFQSQPEMSDAENLLAEVRAGEEEEPKPTFRHGRVLALGAASAALALCATGAAAFSGKTQVEELATPSAVVGLFSVPDGCFKQGMFYVHPILLPGAEKTSEVSAEDCQAKCKATDGCQHFTYWPDGGCLLTGDASSLRAAGISFSDTIVGPKD
eukprot:gb/GFBE01029889.1/.p1 GENE.gb/GFBE01029889.1/~~gb/GFBE01029889.1/.p1  ORF type:complete len:154 (+),score=34.97 gb/GFBE01029889.1/:1-462(+)